MTNGNGTQLMLIGLLLLLPLCTHDGRRGEEQLSGFCLLCGLEHIKSHRVLMLSFHRFLGRSLALVPLLPALYARRAGCSVGQSHHMSKPLHSLLIDIIHDLVKHIIQKLDTGTFYHQFLFLFKLAKFVMIYQRYFYMICRNFA